MDGQAPGQGRLRRRAGRVDRLVDGHRQGGRTDAEGHVPARAPWPEADSGQDAEVEVGDNSGRTKTRNTGVRHLPGGGMGRLITETIRGVGGTDRAAILAMKGLPPSATPAAAPAAGPRAGGPPGRRSSRASPSG